MPWPAATGSGSRSLLARPPRWRLRLTLDPAAELRRPAQFCRRPRDSTPAGQIMSTNAFFHRRARAMLRAAGWSSRGWWGCSPWPDPATAPAGPEPPCKRRRRRRTLADRRPGRASGPDLVRIEADGRQLEAGELEGRCHHARDQRPATHRGARADCHAFCWHKGLRALSEGRDQGRDQGLGARRALGRRSVVAAARRHARATAPPHPPCAKAIVDACFEHEIDRRGAASEALRSGPRSR